MPRRGCKITFFIRAYILARWEVDQEAKYNYKKKRKKKKENKQITKTKNSEWPCGI